jgi:hypothetical protein
MTVVIFLQHGLAALRKRAEVLKVLMREDMVALVVHSYILCRPTFLSCNMDNRVTSGRCGPRTAGRNG